MAQNWRTINPTVETYFNYRTITVYREMLATRFDSSKIVGQDTIWYNYRVADVANYWGPCMSIENIC